jgi:hypothetical protein
MEASVEFIGGSRLYNTYADFFKSRGYARPPGSARVSRAGEAVFGFADFPEGEQFPRRSGSKESYVLAGRQNQHAGRVRYPDPGR